MGFRYVRGSNNTIFIVDHQHHSYASMYLVVTDMKLSPLAVKDLALVPQATRLLHN